MKKWKLSRGGQIVLNLLLTFGVCVGIWINKGAPYPTAMMELRRMERRNLLPASEIVYWQERSTGVGADMVGVGESWVVAAGFHRYQSSCTRTISVQPRTEGPMLVPMPDAIPVMTVPGQAQWCNALVVIQTPEGAVRAELDVDWGDWKGSVEGLEGELRDNGVFFFWFDPGRPDENGNPIGTNWSLRRGAYTLRLYGQEGTLISEHTGIISGGLWSNHYET